VSDFTNAYEDAFNLLCGEKIGGGIHRTVFACRLRPELVVKVETSGDWRYFANVHEMKFWSDHEHFEKVARWLAPCEYLSPDGRLLLQRRIEPLRATDELPVKLPSFLTDVKRDNFGMLDGRIVCADYAMTIPSPSLRAKKVEWA
jgi:hypothetical protein